MAIDTRPMPRHIGEACVFVDPRGQRFDALITAVHGPSCINVVYVNDAPDQKDNYGQKLMRATSVSHGNIQQAWGNFWLLPNEERFPENEHVAKYCRPVSDSALT